MKHPTIQEAQEQLEKALREEGFEFTPETRSVTEIMEETKQAHLANNLINRLIGEKKYKEANKLAWHLYIRFGIDQYLPENK